MRRGLALLGAIVLAAAFSSPVHAAKPASLDLAGAAVSGQHNAWVEQQDDWPMPASPIVNPLPQCAWAVNDHNDWLSGGDVAPGATTSKSQCVVSDFNPVEATRNGITSVWTNADYGYAGMQLRSPSPSLVVSVCYQPQARCFPLSAEWDAAFGSWSYVFCGRANYLPDDPALIDIPGSNGGRGVVTTVTFSVSNPTGTRVRNNVARGGVSSDSFFPDGCVMESFSNPLITHFDYPFAWED